MLRPLLHKLTTFQAQKTALKCIMQPARLGYIPFLKNRQYSILVPRFQQIPSNILLKNTTIIPFECAHRPVVHIQSNSKRQVPPGYAVATHDLMLTNEEAYALSSEMWQS